MDEATRRLRYAASDLRMAKKKGHHIVYPTMEGAVDVRCMNGVYSLTARGRTLAEGRRSLVQEELAKLYVLMPS